MAGVEEYYFGGEEISGSVRVTSPEQRPSLILNGRTMPLGEDPLAAVRVRAHRLGDGCLLSLFNLRGTKEPRLVRVAVPGLPQGDCVIRDRRSGRFLRGARGTAWPAALLGREGLLVSVPPMGMRILEIRRKAPGESLEPTEPAAIAPAPGNTAGQGDLGSRLAVGGTSLSWVETDGDGIPEVQVETPSQKVILSLAGGRLRSWRPATAGQDLLRTRPETDVETRYGVGACYDMFFLPQAARWSGDEKAAYDCVARHVDANGDARVSLKRSIASGPLAGLLLAKDYLVSAARPRLGVSVAVSNGSDPPQEVSLWVRSNAFVLGRGARALTLPLQEGVRRYDGEKAQTLLCLAPGRAALVGLREEPGGTLREGWLEWSDAGSGDRVRVTLEADRLHQLYLCLPHTLEWMYTPRPMGFGARQQVRYQMEFLRKP